MRPLTLYLLVVSAILAVGVGVVVMLANSEREAPSAPLTPEHTEALRHRVATTCHLDESRMGPAEVGTYSVSWPYEGRQVSIALFEDAGTVTC